MRNLVNRVVAVHKAPTHRVIYGHGAEIFGGLAGLAGFSTLANLSIIAGAVLMLCAILAYQPTA